MRPIRTAENIIPVSDFKARAAQCLRQLARNSEPFIITQNGRAAGVVLSPAMYDLLTERFRFMKAVDEGLADVGAGRVTPHKEVIAEMRQRFRDSDES